MCCGNVSILQELQTQIWTAGFEIRGNKLWDTSGPRLGKTSMNESSWSAVEIEKFGAGAWVCVTSAPLCLHRWVFIDGSWFGAGQIPSLIILLVTEHVWEIISFNYVLVFPGHVDFFLLVPGYMPMTNTWTWSLVKLRRGALGSGSFHGGHGFFVDEAIQEISYVREEVPGKDWSSWSQMTTSLRKHPWSVT